MYIIRHVSVYVWGCIYDIPPASTCADKTWTYSWSECAPQNTTFSNASHIPSHQNIVAPQLDVRFLGCVNFMLNFATAAPSCDLELVRTQQRSTNSDLPRMDPLCFVSSHTQQSLLSMSLPPLSKRPTLQQYQAFPTHSGIITNNVPLIVALKYEVPVSAAFMLVLSHVEPEQAFPPVLFRP